MHFGIATAMEATRNYISEMLGRELQGLCATCDHRIACIYRQQANKVIIQCELFSTPVPVIPSLPVSSLTRKRNARGLCDTCIHQRTCSFFLRNGYVWHCEEFA